MIKFKKITFCLLMFFALANCAQHSVKFGKRCTAADSDGLKESSYVWLISQDALKSFDKRINKSNCSGS